ncbi:hypothetical protein CAEBREN_17578 [Caenorhabditis brenneri]|uniref:Uncharacterized protein n=1 Tax=Caenorhabditis brenneri TaxID=135651 RepID=G0NZU8_CAEBE|nr:hypothetical protein CAEBREN_17578 [Caenorhabditis brenneri]
MSSTELFEIVVEYAEKSSSRHCSPSPSTSSSSASSTASSSGSSTPNSQTSNKNTRVRRFSKTKKSVMTSLRRSSRKFVTDKQYQQKLAETKARIERLKREREELHAGNSQIAILCEEVTTSARSLRETYERQRPVIFHAVLSNFLEQVEEAYDDEEGGFIGTYFY